MPLPSIKLRIAVGLFVVVSIIVAPGCAKYSPEPVRPAMTATSLESRTLEDPGLLAFIQMQSGTHFNTWDFESLTLAAIYWNPSLQVLRAEWSTIRAAETVAAGRPNPTVGVGPDYNFNAGPGITPWIGNFNFDWPMETAGKRSKRITRARILSEVGRLRLIAAAWEVRARVRESVIAVVGAGQRIQILTDWLAVQERMAGLQESRLKAGAVSDTEAASFRIALARGKLDLLAAQASEVEARSHLAETLGLPLSAVAALKLGMPDGLASEDAGLGSAEMRRSALLGRADVLAALADYDAAEEALRLEIAKQYPDVHLGTGYQFDQGDNKWQIGISSELPLLNRNQGPILEANARRAEMAARFSAVQSRVIAELDRVLSAWRSASAQGLSQAALVEEIRQRSSSVASQARAGALEPMDAAAAEAELASARLAEFESRLRAIQARGAVEEVMQRPWASVRAVESVGIKAESKAGGRK